MSKKKQNVISLIGLPFLRKTGIMNAREWEIVFWGLNEMLKFNKFHTLSFYLIKVSLTFKNTFLYFKFMEVKNVYTIRNK